MNEDKLRNIPLAALDFACEGCVEMQPARSARERVAPAPTSARAPLRDEMIRQQAVLAERAVQAEPARSREDAILDAAMLPEQGELAAELIASGIELGEALTFLAGDLLQKCDELEQRLQRSGHQ